MKKMLLLLIGAAALAAAAPQAELIPVGIWPLCAAGNYPGCDTFTPGRETFTIYFAGGDPVVSYRWHLHAVRVLDGVAINLNGFLDAGVAPPVIACGIVSAIELTVSEIVTRPRATGVVPVWGGIAAR